MTLLTQTKWTASTVRELHKLAAARRQAVPPAVRLDALTIFETIAGPAENWQRALLCDTSQEILVVSSRQIGKSTCAAAAGLETLLTKAGATVAVIATRETQAAELLYRMRSGYYTLGQPLGRPIADSTTMLYLSNGSRAIALPSTPTAARSYSIDLLLLDEAAYLPSATYYAARPLTFGVRGRILALTTAGIEGQGWFYEAYHSDDPQWQRYEIPATHSSRISAEQLDRERAALPEVVFNAEYVCQWMPVGGSSLFAPYLIEQAFRNTEIEALW